MIKEMQKKNKKQKKTQILIALQLVLKSSFTKILSTTDKFLCRFVCTLYRFESKFRFRGKCKCSTLYTSSNTLNKGQINVAAIKRT